MAVIEFSGGVNNSLRVQKWAEYLFNVHYRTQFWYPFHSSGPDNVVIENTDFTKTGGYQMTEALFMPFESAGVTGDAKLEDAEEAPDFYHMTWTITQLRNAGRVAGKETEQQQNYKLPAEIKSGLGEWLKEKCDEAEFTAIAANCTKIIYVNDRSGTSAVTATDLLTIDYIFKAATYAKSTASPKIKPVKIKGEGGDALYRYHFVMHDHVWFDLAVNDPTYQTVVAGAGVRGDINPIFTGARADFHGIMLHAHDNCTIATGWGSGSDVYGAESYLLGNQAMIVGIGGYAYKGGTNQGVKYVEKLFDYENQYGVAIGKIKGEAKIVFNSKDFGVVAVRSARTNI